MDDQSSHQSTSPTQITAREKSILEATIQLMSHYGYDKTTMNDIARQAGISKGAIYLHFESKETLFDAVVNYEITRYSEHWIALMETDEEAGTIGSIYRNIMIALRERDLLMALFTHDKRILGSLIQSQPIHLQRKMGVNQALITQLQQIGSIRQDMNATLIAYIMNMLAYALASMEHDNYEQAPAIDDIINGIGTLLDWALTPTDGGNLEAGKALILNLAHHARQQYINNAPPPQNDDIA